MDRYQASSRAKEEREEQPEIQFGFSGLTDDPLLHSAQIKSHFLTPISAPLGLDSGMQRIRSKIETLL